MQCLNTAAHSIISQNKFPYDPPPPALPTFSLLKTRHRIQFERGQQNERAWGDQLITPEQQSTIVHAMLTNNPTNMKWGSIPSGKILTLDRLPPLSVTITIFRRAICVFIIIEKPKCMVVLRGQMKEKIH